MLETANKPPLLLSDMTRELWKNRPRHITYDQACDKAQVTMGWLQGFIRSRTRDAGVDKVQRLYEFLKGESLFKDR